MDIDTNSEAYKSGGQVASYLVDALRKAGEELLEKALRMEPIIVGDLHRDIMEDDASGVYTPSGPVVDSTVTPVESGVLALPERKVKEE